MLALVSQAETAVPDYYDGQDLFSDDYKPVDHVVGARDRCDFTIDRIRTVRTDKFRYIRNYFPDRALLQPAYRDKLPTVKDLKRLHESGELTEYQSRHRFGVRPKEELYDLAADPHQINNLATDSEHVEVLAEHRSLLDKWIVASKDLGQQPEPSEKLIGTYELWEDKPVFKEQDVNPEYDQFRK